MCPGGELTRPHPLTDVNFVLLQLTIICTKLGKLPDSELDFVTSDKARRFMRKLPNKAPTPLHQQLPAATAVSLDSMRQMLQIHPKRRATVEQALQHTFFKTLHNPKEEPVSSRPFDFSFEREKLRRLRLQELIWREVGDFRPGCMPVAPSKTAPA